MKKLFKNIIVVGVLLTATAGLFFAATPSKVYAEKLSSFEKLSLKVYCVFYSCEKPQNQTVLDLNEFESLSLKTYCSFFDCAAGPNLVATNEDKNSAVISAVVNSSVDKVIKKININSVPIVTQTTQGAQGPRGLQGIQGAQGERGTQGLQGEQGIQGERGPRGSSGSDGTNGTNGTDGVDGVNGANMMNLGTGATINPTTNTISCLNDGEILQYDLGTDTWNCVTPTTGTDSQSLTLVGNLLSLTNGGSIDLSSFLDDTDTTYSAGNGIGLSGTTFAVNAPTCSGTQKLQWTGSAFVCSADVDTDTVLTESQVDAYANNNGYLLSETDGSVTNELTTNVQLSGTNLLVTDAGGTFTVDLSSFLDDTDTTYSAGNGIGLSGTTFAVNAPTCSGTDKLQWTGAAFVCSADVDTDTVLTESQVDAYANNNGYLLSETDGSVTNELTTNVQLSGTNLLVTDAGGTFTVDLSSFLDDTDTTYSAGNGIGLSGTTFAVNAPTCSGTDKLQWTGAAFVCSADVDTDTVLTESQVDAYANNNGYLLSETDGSVTNELTTNVQLSGTNLLVTDAGGTFTVDLSSFLDDTDTTYSAGNGIGLSGTTFAVNAPTCSGTQKLQWTGSAFVCSADVDTDTVLTESQVDAYANNNGYLLSETDGSVTNELTTNVQLSGTNLLVTDAGGTFTVDLSSFLDDTDTTYSAGNGIGLSGTTFAVNAPTCSGTQKLQWTGSAFVCSADVDTDTVLTESQVDAYANNNGYLLSETDGSVTNELTTNVQLSGTNLLVTDAGGTFTVDLSSFLDDTDTTYSAGNGIGLSGTTFAVNAPTCSGTQKLQWTGSAFVCSADVDTDTVLTESQVDAYANNNGYLLSETDGSVTNELTTNVQLSGTNLLVTDAGGTFTVDLSSFLDDTDTTYSAGNGIGLSGTTFAVNAPTCSGTQKLQWTGSAFVCSADVDTDTVLTESQVDAYANNNGYLLSETDGSVTNELTTNVQLSGTNLLVTDAGGTFTVDLSSFLDDTDTTYSAGNGIGLSGTTFAVNAPTCSGTDKLQWTGAAFVCSADVDTDTVLTESQVDAYANNNGYLLSETDGSVTNELTTNVQLSGTNLLVTDAGGTFTVDLSSFLDDTDTTYSAGNGIGLSGTTFAVNAPTCSGTDKLQWTGAAFVCSADVDTDTVLTESQVDAYANNNGYLLSETDGSVTNELTTNVQLSGTNLLVTDAGGTFTVDLSSFLDDTDTTYSAGNGIGLSGTTFAVNAPTCSGTQKLQWTGSAFVCSADVDTDTVLTESQVDAYANNNGYLLSETDGSVTNELTTNVQLSGTNLLVTDAGGTFTVDLSSFLDDTDTTYSAGNGIGLSGTTFAVNAPTCSGTQKLQWTGSAFVCSADVDTDTVLTESQVDAYANNNGYLLSETDGSVTNELTTNVQLSGTNLLVTDAGGTFTVDLSSFLDDTDTTYSAGNGIGLSGTTFAVNAPTCSGTQKLQWTGSAFVCSADVDTDTVLTESQVDAYANNNGYLLSETDGSVTNELTTNVQLSGTNLLVTDAGGTFTVDLSSFLDDTDTTYSAGNGIGLSGTTFAVNAPTCSGTDKLQWTGAAFVCSADVDTDTVLTESQVDAYANNNGYLLSETDGSVTNELTTNVQLSGTNLLVTDAGGTFTVDLSSFLDDTDTTYSAGNGIGLSGTTFAVNAPTCSGTQKLQWTGSAFVCSADVDTDTVLTESQVDAYANNNGYLLSETDGSVTNELTTNVQLSGTNLLVTDAGGTFTVDLSSFLDDTDTTYSAGNGIGLSGTTFAVNAPTCSGTQKLQWTGSAFVCSADVDTDTVLTESQVDAYANNNGYLLSETDGSVTNELTTNVQLSGTNLLVTDAGGTFTVDLSSFLDDTDTTYSAGNGIGLSGTTFAVNAPTCSGTDKLQWTGAAFVCSADVDTDSGGTVTSVAASGGTTGLTFTGSPITSSGTLTLGGTLDLANGGTGSTTAAGARTNLGLGSLAILSAITTTQITDGTIVNADISATANIALSKLANGNNIITSLGVPSGSNANGGSISANVLTLSLADGINPGLVSTGTQTFAGPKTFTGTPTFSTMTQGSVLFAGPSGILSQNNSQFFWDDANNSLGINTSSPDYNLTVGGNARISQNLLVEDSQILTSRQIYTEPALANDLVWNLLQTAPGESDPNNTKYATITSGTGFKERFPITRWKTGDEANLGQHFGYVGYYPNEERVFRMNTAGESPTKLALGTMLQDAIFIDENQLIGIGTDSPTEKLQVAGNLYLEGAFLDANGDAGSAGQVLSSTVTGTDWINAPGVMSLGVPSGTNANGGSISGNVLTLSLADVTNPGLVSATTQTFGGNKTFANNLLVNGTTTLGDAGADAVILNAATVTGQNATTITTTAGNSLTLSSGTTGLISLDSGTTGGINIGTGANAKTITLGNSTVATGTIINSGVTTGNALQLNATSLTTGNAFQIIGPASRNILRIQNEANDPLDTQRVIIGQGQGLKPDSLARDQLYVFGRINSSWDSFGSDFLTGRTALTADGQIDQGLWFDEVGASTATYTSIAGYSGILRVAIQTAGANVTDWVGSGGVQVTQRSLNPVFEARLQSDASTDHRMIVGFHQAAAGTTITADANNYANEVFFRKTAAGTNWTAVTRNTSGTETVTNLTTQCGGSCTTNTMRILRIELENSGANGEARFYIDGNLVATHNNTSIPAIANRLAWGIGQSVTAVTPRFYDLDYVRVWSDDPKDAQLNITGEVTDANFDFLNESVVIDLEGLSETVIRKDIDDEGFGQVIADVKYYLLKTQEVIINGILRVKEIIVSVLKAQKIETEELCVGNVCVTEQQFLELFENNNIDYSTNENEPEVSGEDETSDENQGTNDTTTSGDSSEGTTQDNTSSNDSSENSSEESPSNGGSETTSETSSENNSSESTTDSTSSENSSDNSDSESGGSSNEGSTESGV